MALDDCPYCPVRPPAQTLFHNELTLFVRDERYQGALKHSGVIVPRAHRATLFDLTGDEIRATFDLLRQVKAWMDATLRPDG
jgi:histidine triad (HIT) family protein